MDVISVPRPSKKAMNPNRPVSGLLLTQIQHLQHAERRLPLKYRSSIYTHAIRTEGEASEYIREVTEAIHQAHADAEAQRTKRTRVRKTGIVIAAAAQKPRRKRSSASMKRVTAKKKSARKK